MALSSLQLAYYYTFEKDIMCYFTSSIGLTVCLSVCLSVITFVARWLDLVAWCQLRLIPPTRIRKCSASHKDLFPGPDRIDRPHKITFWPITYRAYRRIYTKF